MGVNFYEGGARDPRAWAVLLPEYAALGVDLIAVPARARFFDTGAAGAPVAVYHGSVVDVWRLGGAAPYVWAAGCGVVASSRDDVVTECSGRVHA